MCSCMAAPTRINAREKAGHVFARTVAFESLVVHGPGAYAVLCEGEASDDISPINDGRKGMRITLHNAEAAPGVAVLTVKERPATSRSEEHTSELQSLMRNSYAVFCLKQKTKTRNKRYTRVRKRLTIARNE